MENEKEIEKFNKWVGENHNTIVQVLKKACYFNSMEFSYDVWHNVLLATYSAIEGGSKLKYGSPDDRGSIYQYIYLAYKQEYNRQKGLSYNKKIQLTDFSDEYFDIPEDESTTEEDNAEFMEKYKFLVRLEYDIKNTPNMEKYAEILKKKIDGGVLSKGERGDYEFLKKYIKTHYQEDYERLITKLNNRKNEYN